MAESRILNVQSTESSAFRERAFLALDGNGELLVAYSLAYGAGWIEWHLVRTREELLALLSSGERRSIFDIYLTRQLQLRGIAGPDLQAQLLSVLRESKEVLMATPSPQRKTMLEHVGTALDHSGTDEERGIQEWFAEHSGLEILAGQEPFTLPRDATLVLEGRVPDADGKVRSASF